MAFAKPVMHDSSSSSDAASDAAAPYGRGYAGFLVKNAVGYLLMMSALVVGSVFPLPLGTPMFLVGFAMVSFPGKRRMTSSALRGIPINLRSRKSRLWQLAVALILPPIVLWVLALNRHPVLHPAQMPMVQLCGINAAAIIAAWILTWLFLVGLNMVVRNLPRVRRHIRPWLRDHGINLLPPRRKRTTKAATI